MTRLADLADALADLGVQVVTGVIVDRVAAGGWWRCADGCGRRGRVDDPRLSPLAVAAVVEGRRFYPRRTDLAATVEITDPDRTAEQAAFLVDLIFPDFHTEQRLLARAGKTAGHRHAEADLDRRLLGRGRPASEEHKRQSQQEPPHSKPPPST